VHDALKRRCLYHWVEHPTIEREIAVIRLRAPEVSERLAGSVARAAARIREAGVYKPPGLAESIDWATAVAALGREDLDVEVADATLGTVVKYREDQSRLRARGVEHLLG
jgi:MoxR-like ATPase